MSITITGGISFSGGVGIVAPPSTPTAGWYAGGWTFSTVDRITFANDTATASVRGPLNAPAGLSAGTGNTTDGWFGGGYVNGVLASSTNRITYSTDTATASVRGPLATASWGLASTSDNATYGWFGAGYNGTDLSSISRITYGSDTVTATSRGPLSSARYSLYGTGTSSYGWFGGGVSITTSPSGTKSTIDRIDYANDTATASARGPLSTAYNRLAASTDYTTYGWFSGGQSGSGTARSLVQRITYSTDTSTASVRGPLSASTYALAGVCDATYGWFGGGYVLSPNANTSTVTRITYATDTATSTNRSLLSLARRYPAAASGIQ